MNCYDAFNDIVEDFKHLLDRREKSIRQVEETLSENLLDESNVVRRLEHQIAVLRQDLVLHPSALEVPYMCSNCYRPLVHDQYSQEIFNNFIISKKRKNKDCKNETNHAKKITSFDSLGLSQSSDAGYNSKAPGRQPWSSVDKPDLGHQTRFQTPVPDYPSFSSNTKPNLEANSSGPNSFAEQDSQRSLNRYAGIQVAQDDIEKRMMRLNEKVDKVTSKTRRMLSRSSHLNDNSQVLKDQVMALQQDLRSINQNLQ